MTLDRFKIISDIVSAWFGLIAVVAGGAFAVIQYLEKEQGDRVKYSLDLLARANDAQVVAAKTRLTTIWHLKKSDLFDAAVKESTTPGAYNQFVIQTAASEGLYPPFATMLDFYETVQICIDRHVCDAPVTCALFHEDASRLYTLHFPLVEVQRKERKDPAYAVRLQAFSGPTTCP